MLKEMTIGQVIDRLHLIKDRHGDLPLSMPDGMIGAIAYELCEGDVARTTDGEYDMSKVDNICLEIHFT